jgi:hypothetical protein
MFWKYWFHVGILKKKLDDSQIAIPQIDFLYSTLLSDAMLQRKRLPTAGTSWVQCLQKVNF